MATGLIVALGVSLAGNVVLFVLLLLARRLTAELVLHMLKQQDIITRTSEHARTVGAGVAKCLHRQEERRAATA